MTTLAVFSEQPDIRQSLLSSMSRKHQGTKVTGEIILAFVEQVETSVKKAYCCTGHLVYAYVLCHSQMASYWNVISSLNAQVGG